MRKKIPIASIHPELLEEWDWQKNREISPYEIACTSDIKVWWKCKTCDHTWQTAIRNRHVGTGCPECGKRRMGENHRRTALRNGDNSLALINPE